MWKQTQRSKVKWTSGQRPCRKLVTDLGPLCIGCWPQTLSTRLTFSFHVLYCPCWGFLFSLTQGLYQTNSSSLSWAKVTHSWKIFSQDSPTWGLELVFILKQTEECRRPALPGLFCLLGFLSFHCLSNQFNSFHFNKYIWLPTMCQTLW